MAEPPPIDEQTRTRIESRVFRALVDHLREHPEVQNIDLMNLAGFCRNCLSKWYVSAAADQGLELGYDQAREVVYGMPYGEYKQRYQREATQEQLAGFAAAEGKSTR